VLAALALALVVGVPTAAPDVSLQPVTIACSVDSPFTLAVDADTLPQLALALAAMTDPTCAITQTDPSASRFRHFAVGGGLTAEGVKFSFSDHPNSHQVASGYAHVSGVIPFFGAADVQGHVTCLSISGENAAQVGFEFEKGSIAANPALTNGLFEVVDNGPPAGLTPDAFHFVAASTSPVTCGTTFQIEPNVVQGNIVVR
jgi:hypothetical protein